MISEHAVSWWQIVQVIGYPAIGGLIYWRFSSKKVGKK